MSVANPESDEAYDARMARYRGHLERLAEIGMRRIEALEAEAETADPPMSALEAAQVFAYLSRAVRQAIALDARLVREARMRRLEAERDQWRDEAWVTRHARKDEVRQALHQVCDSAPTSKSVLDLKRRLDNRLERDDDHRDACFAELSPGEIIVRIARDLGLDPDWTAYGDRPWGPDAAEAARTLGADSVLEVHLRNWDDDGNEIEPDIVHVTRRRRR